jgi:hypothetical protein
MMDLLEFRKNYLENVKAVAAAENKGTSEAFVQVTCDNLINNESFDDYELSFYTGMSKRRKYRIDAYSFDDYDKSMTLLVADYFGEQDIVRLTQTDAEALFGRLRVVVEESLSGRLKNEVEISTPTYDLVDRLYSLKSEMRKIKFFIVTDKAMSDKINTFAESEIEGILCEYHLWDIGRLYRMLESGRGHEPLEIQIEKYIKGGIPCLVASDVTIDNCKCYLSVLPGTLLADIYDQYGSRLLEGNVRTFLSARGNVNKGIRRTILGNERTMFFAYNNGIAATASDIKLKVVCGQQHITYVKNLQIVNGGQTTASLSNTRFKDKSKLDGIFVQMKLTVIEDNEIAGKIIPNISRCSNSQNKVSEADFFSNHEFNIRMQTISRNLYAPAALGIQYETHWFYERARGQYENEQSKMTDPQKNKFRLSNPTSQRFDKTMLAKLVNTWREYPHIASAGAQKSFKKWADTIVVEYDRNSDTFNELYFKKIIALLIIFRNLEKSIPKSNWYGGYRANIIVYSLAFLHCKITLQYPDMVLDLVAIWSRQRLDEEFEKQMMQIAEHIFEIITDDNRDIMNVTEWCKHERCWFECKKSAFSLSPTIEKFLISVEDAAHDVRSGKKDQETLSGIEAQTKVVKKGYIFWKNVAEFLVDKKKLSPKETGILRAAVSMNGGRIPSVAQSFIILDILEKAKDEGFIEE